MNKALTYEQALESHPEQVADIVQQVRKGRSKTKNTEPNTWGWSYDWCIEIEGYSFGDLLTGKEERDRRRQDAMSLEESVDALLNRSHVCLSAHGRSSDVSSEVLREHYTRSVAEERAEEARVAALSPAEKDKMFQDAFQYLMGPKNKGFVALHLPPLPPQGHDHDHD